MIEQHHLAGFEQALFNRKPCPVCCERPARRGGRYCSDACRQKAYRQRKAQHNTHNVMLSDETNGILGDILAELQALRRENSELRGELAELKQMPLALQTIPTGATITTPQLRQAVPLTNDLENDERLNLTIEQAKSTGNANKNFAISTAVITGNILDLSLDLLEYGLAQGDLGITPQIIAQKQAQLASKTTPNGENKPTTQHKKKDAPEPPKGQAKVILGADLVDTPAPDLESLELDW